MNGSYKELLNQALELHSEGELDNAKKIYKKILEINPSESIALAWLGTIEAINKNFENARRLIQRALEIDPNNADYSANLATILCECNLLEEALFNINSSMNINSKNPSYFKTRAQININLEKYDEALFDLNMAKNLLGQYDSDLLLMLGNALLGLGEIKEALLSYENAINLDSSNYEAYVNIGNLLATNGNRKDAIKAYESAISINNDYSKAYSGLASVYLDLDNLVLAENYCIKSIEKDKLNIDALNFYGLLEIKKSNFQRAILYFEEILKINPENPDAKYNKSLVLLRLNNFDLGLPLFESRWQTKEFKKCNNLISIPLWLGDSDIKSKRILIYSEQGLGDSIQYVRYLGEIVKLGAVVSLRVPYALLALFRQIKGINIYSSTDFDSIIYDFRCPLMSLPLALGGMGNYGSYLDIEYSNIERWKKHIGDMGLKVAICWQGNQNSEIDIGRSFSVNLFRKISKLNGIRLISLQKNRLSSDTTNLKELDIEELPQDFDTVDGAFMDSAAIMKVVDLVITSDTALTHLAGALGVRTWLLLQHVPDWRWGRNSKDTFWYPNHRLFRQNIRGDWDSVFDEVKKELVYLQKSMFKK
jgi:tetratricopeptide (TPR) repeat protein